MADSWTDFEVNGTAMRLPKGTTLTELLQRMGLEGRRVAVECNGRLVVRSLLSATAIESGDSIEVVRAVGGG